MKLLGFYVGLHDSNLTIYDGKIRYIKSERFHQKKHHRSSFQWINETCERFDFSPDMVAFSDGNRNELGECPSSKLFSKITTFRIRGRDVPTFCLDHHYAHILSAWPIKETAKVDYGVTVDGKGDHKRRISVIARPGFDTASCVFCSADYAYGDFFTRVGSLMKLKGDPLDHAGKIMGANAYGEIDHDFVEKFRQPDIAARPSLLIDKISWRGSNPKNQNNFFSFDHQSFRDWLATTHHLLGLLISDVLIQHIPLNATIAYAGGAAQNSVFNQKLSSIFPNLNIPPHGYDGGLSLGCVEFLRLKMNLPEFPVSGFPFWQDDPHVGFASASTIEKVAHHIQNGKIVGWMQGKGEIGPRALGHRSILLDARMPTGKRHLNTSVKRREHWRPYAASLCNQNLGIMFENEQASPYMLRAMKLREDIAESLPAITHVDGTCRAQTIRRDTSELSSFHQLIDTVTGLTGAPAILNTSLNAAGGPIISTPEQGLKMFSTTPMDVICIGDKLFEK